MGQTDGRIAVSLNAPPPYGWGVTTVICIAPPIPTERPRSHHKTIISLFPGVRPQQLQLGRQPVPCSRCGDRESPVAVRRRVGGTTRSPDDEARSADRVGTSATNVSPTPRCRPAFVQAATCRPTKGALLMGLRAPARCKGVRLTNASAYRPLSAFKAY